MLKFALIIPLGMWCTEALCGVTPAAGRASAPNSLTAVQEPGRGGIPARPGASQVPWNSPFATPAVATNPAEFSAARRRVYPELVPLNPLDPSLRSSVLASAWHHPAHRSAAPVSPRPESAVAAESSPPPAQIETTDAAAPASSAVETPGSWQAARSGVAESATLPAANAQGSSAEIRPESPSVVPRVTLKVGLPENPVAANGAAANPAPSRSPPQLTQPAEKPAESLAAEATTLGDSSLPLPAENLQVAPGRDGTLENLPALELAAPAADELAAAAAAKSTAPAEGELQPGNGRGEISLHAEQAPAAVSVLANPDQGPRALATNVSRPIAVSPSSGQPRPATAGTVWPIAKSIRTQLAADELSAAESTWSARAEAALTLLETAPSLTDPRIADALDQLSQIVPELRAAADRSHTAAPANGASASDGANPWRVASDLERRLELWQVVTAVAAHRAQAAATPSARSQVSPELVQQLAGIPSAWREFLYLDEVSWQGTDSASAARRTLARMYSQALEPAQRQAVEFWVSEQLEADLRAAAATPAPLDELLRGIEAFQQHPNGRTAAALVEQFQRVYWSESAADLQLAAALNRNYRNANLRLTLSPTLLNQILAQPETWEAVGGEPTDEAAAPRSRGPSSIQVELIPDPASWNISFAPRSGLLARGSTNRDGFVFQNLGGPEIRGARRVAVSLDGDRRDVPAVEQLPDRTWTTAADGAATALSEGSDSSNSPAARTRIRLRIQQRVEQEVHTALQATRERVKREIVQPLAALDLEPQPIEMRTTAEELVLRYRLAGMDQLAADTPRPPVPTGRLATLQVHASFLNNFLARLDLADQAFNAQELRAQLRSRMPQLEWGTDESTATDPQVAIHFAPYDPLRVDLVEGGLNLSLRFKRLQLDPTSEGWRNVTITTRYEPRLSGFRLHLQQVGGVTASSKSLSRGEEIAIAGAFAGLLKSEYQLELLPPAWQTVAPSWNAAVESLQIDDGWVSVVWGAAPAPATTGEHSSELFRPRRRTQLR